MAVSSHPHSRPTVFPPVPLLATLILSVAGCAPSPCADLKGRVCAKAAGTPACGNAAQLKGADECSVYLRDVDKYIELSNLKERPAASDQAPWPVPVPRNAPFAPNPTERPTPGNVAADSECWTLFGCLVSCPRNNPQVARGCVNGCLRGKSRIAAMKAAVVFDCVTNSGCSDIDDCVNQCPGALASCIAKGAPETPALRFMWFNASFLGHKDLDGKPCRSSPTPWRSR